METVITSASNQTLKQVRKLLTSSKARREANTYVAEGIHLAQSALDAQVTPTLCVYAVSALHNPEIVQLKAILDNANSKSVVVADTLFESLSSVHASVGILALFSPTSPKVGSLQPLERSAVLLDDIQDPGNLGTILRTAAAVGVRDILLSMGCASPWSPKALRAGMGAQYSLAIYEDADPINSIRSARIPVFATSLSNESKSLYSLDLVGPAVWIFGNEGQGVSETLLQTNATKITIPQASGPVESLNVAAAATVCLYEHYRQNLSLRD